jgi:hypothetical protein
VEREIAPEPPRPPAPGHARGSGSPRARPASLFLGARILAWYRRRRHGRPADVFGRADGYALTRWYDVKPSHEPQGAESNEKSQKQHQRDLGLNRFQQDLDINRLHRNTRIECLVPQAERIGNRCSTLSSCTGPYTGSGGMAKPPDKKPAPSTPPPLHLLPMRLLGIASSTRLRVRGDRPSVHDRGGEERARPRQASRLRRHYDPNVRSARARQRQAHEFRRIVA